MLMQKQAQTNLVHLVCPGGHYFVSFFENESVRRTNRAIRWRRMPLKRSI